MAASADGQGGRALSLLCFFQQLDAVVAVELDGSPVSAVGDQEWTLLQTALAVCFSGDAQLHDVPHQVGLHRGPLCLGPRTLQDAALA